MRIAMDTVNITELQRNALAQLIDGTETRRVATRAECKEYIWRHGSRWPRALDERCLRASDLCEVETWNDEQAAEIADDLDDLIAVDAAALADDELNALLGADDDDGPEDELAALI